MIELKEAVQAARKAAGEYFESEDIENLRLEEFQRSDDGKHWLITLGFDVPRLPWEKTAVAKFLGVDAMTLKSLRQYKVFEVDSETGEVESMKVRVV